MTKMQRKRTFIDAGRFSGAVDDFCIWLPAGIKLPADNATFVRLNIAGKKIRSKYILGVRKGTLRLLSLDIF
jgi:hypothetical protein